MKSIVRQDNGQSYNEYLKELAQAARNREPDAGTVGTPGSEAEEEGIRSGVEEPQRSGCADLFSHRGLTDLRFEGPLLLYCPQYNRRRRSAFRSKGPPSLSTQGLVRRRAVEAGGEPSSSLLLPVAFCRNPGRHAAAHVGADLALPSHRRSRKALVARAFEPVLILLVVHSTGEVGALLAYFDGTTWERGLCRSGRTRRTSRTEVRRQLRG
jgi:hypothetical protein